MNKKNEHLRVSQGDLIWTVFVKTLTGKTLTLKTNENDYVYGLKWKIRDSEGIPPQQLRLIFAGKQMEDSRRLKDYGMSNECTVMSVLRLRCSGG